jgi:hypothetical protein
LRLRGDLLVPLTFVVFNAVRARGRDAPSPAAGCVRLCVMRRRIAENVR